jgi:hypothetical protein
MNRRLVLGFFSVFAVIMFFSDNGFCQQVSNEEIMEELKALKTRVRKLEEELNKKDAEIKKLRMRTAEQKIVSDEGEEKAPEGGFLDKISDRVSVSGLVEVGAAYEDVHNNDGTDEDSSDINLTTVEIGVAVEVNDWLNLETVFLYEDPFGNDAADESDVTVDVSTVNIGNTEKCPFYASAGKMYVPFGALLTHLPDDPLVEQPMALLLGETSEKSVLVGFEQNGFNVSGYVFNGDMDESASDNTIENFGFDANYTASEDYPLELFAGVSYISNIADSDGLTEYLEENAVTVLEDYVDGFAAYLHLGFKDFFLAGEYMTALDEFDTTEIPTGIGAGAEPSVWNIETGYNWNWGKNLEIVFKYAGSDETETLGYPEKRYGIGFNQEIFESVTGSVAYFRDKFHSDDADNRDDRDFLCGQLAIEF